MDRYVALEAEHGGDGSIILKWIHDKQDITMQTGCIQSNLRHILFTKGGLL
jgi:hypothetical protein